MTSPPRRRRPTAARAGGTRSRAGDASTKHWLPSPPTLRFRRAEVRLPPPPLALVRARAALHAAREPPRAAPAPPRRCWTGCSPRRGRSTASSASGPRPPFARAPRRAGAPRDGAPNDAFSAARPRTSCRASNVLSRGAFDPPNPSPAGPGPRRWNGTAVAVDAAAAAAAVAAQRGRRPCSATAAEAGRILSRSAAEADTFPGHYPSRSCRRRRAAVWSGSVGATQRRLG